MHKIEIKYCYKCRWLLRSTWMAQELLTTFEEDISELSLLPGTGGIFEIIANGQIIWSRKEKGRFPEIAELKQCVRDAIAPHKNLGCIDRKTAKAPIDDGKDSEN
jgi:selenoprotein W-related protein